jgi:4-amino-4-deoxy-L-arabinose transferase-like glycosyltransferase
MTMMSDTMRAELQTRWLWLAVCAVLLIGLGFRLPEIGSRSLWIDELYTHWFASRGYLELWRDVPQYETHPPVYYTLLKAWTGLFGESEAGLRSLSLIASLATILAVATSGPFLAPAGQARFRVEAAGLLAALFLAVNAASIRDAQNARPYALQTLLITLAILAALALIERLARQDGRAQRGDWLGPAMLMGLTAGASLLFHNTSFFVAFGLWAGLAAAVTRVPGEARLMALSVLLGAGVLALLVWAPYAPIFFAQSTAFMNLAFWLTPKLRDLWSAWELVIGGNLAALCLAIVLLVYGLTRLAQVSARQAIVAGVTLLLPLYALLAVSFSVKPIYIQRLFDWMVPLALLVVAHGVVALPGRLWIRGLMAAAVIGLSTQRTIEDFQKPIDDWKRIAQVIADEAQPGDVVIAAPAEGSVAVDYYARRHPDFPPVVYIPGPYPQRGLDRIYMSNLGAPQIAPEDRVIVEAALKRYRRVWLVQVSIALYDPKSIIRSTIAEKRRFVRFDGNSLAKVELFD